MSDKTIAERRDWKMVDIRYQKNGQIRIFDSTGRHVANVNAHNHDCAALAAKICRAVNLYEKQFPDSPEVRNVG